MKKKLLMGIGLFFIGVIIITECNAVLGIPAVTVTNNLEYDVGLRNCVDWRSIPAGKSKQIHPDSPCSVYSKHGSVIGYEGCLHIPENAFTHGQEVLLGEFQASVTQPDCARGPEYDEYSRLRRGLDGLWEWVAR